MQKRVVVAVAFLALAGVVGFVARGGPGALVTAGGSAGSSGARPPMEAGGVDEAVSGAHAPATSAKTASELSAELGPSAVPGLGAEVIKDARLSLQVKRRGLQDALVAASATAGRLGGYVQSTSSGGRTGTIQLRVPAASFEAALGSLKQLGTVTGQTVSGRDVTSQFVDLNARLITWRAQETVLLRLMDGASSISDTLRVQSQLQQVQFKIEQIRGALRVLRDQTSYGTIQVLVREVGAPVAATATAATPSLVRAWQQAWAGFLGVLSAVIVGLGYLVPLALLALAGWAVARRVLRARPAPEPAAAS
jgi:hypothetical protein